MAEDKETREKPTTEELFSLSSGTESGMERFQRIINVASSFLLTVLSLVLLAGIIVSLVHLPSYFTGIVRDADTGLKDLVNHVSFLIIVIELVLLLNMHDLKSVIEILMIAFTRSLVIREWTMTELFVGVVSIAVLFATRKYLMHRGEENT